MRTHNDGSNMSYEVVKRILDIVIALLGLIIFLPVFVAIAILIKLDSEGPVYYCGARIGKDGKPFKLIKFRTLVNNADKLGGSSTASDDPRITKVGRILRASKLDELPQLVNVLKGEMSSVGPRPQVQWAVELYGEKERELLTVRPGITDYASIRFRNEAEILKGSDNPDKTYLEIIAPEKIKLGLEYIENKSFWVDARIIAGTIRALFTKTS